jgi:hypothetical protein
MPSVTLAAWRTLPPSATAAADSRSRSHLVLRLNSPTVGRPAHLVGLRRPPLCLGGAIGRLAGQPIGFAFLLGAFGLGAKRRDGLGVHDAYFVATPALSCRHPRRARHRGHVPRRSGPAPLARAASPGRAADDRP